MRRYIAAGLTAAVFIFLALMALIPSTDDFAPNNPLWNGLSLLVKSTNATLIYTSEVERLPPESTLFIIGPSKNFTLEEASILREFVERGGLLVIAEDYGTANNLLKDLELKTKILSGVLLDPLFKHKSSKLPRVKAKVGGRDFTLYFNYGSALKRVEGVCIGFSSYFSFLDLNGDLKHDGEEPTGPLCTIEEVRLGRGLIIVISDSSVFINSMISLGDNLELAKFFTRGRRTYVLADKWEVGLYSLLRSTSISFIALLTHTSLRYPALSLLTITAYYFGRRVYEMRVRRVKSLREHLEDYVRDLTAKHPSWDSDLLRKMVYEVYSSGRLDLKD